MNAREKTNWSDDPRLTAYALGEMSGEERAGFEDLIAGDEEAAKLVVELRAIGGVLEQELAAEAAPGLTDLQRQRIEASARAAGSERRGFYRVRAWAAVAATLLVAGFGVTWMLNSQGVRHFSGDSTARPRAAAPAATESMRALEGLGYVGDGDAPAPGSEYHVEAELQELATGHRVESTLSSASDERIVVVAQGVATGEEDPRYEPGFAADQPSREQYAPIFENPFFLATRDPLSTFSIDVDTASYANVRRFLESGTLPPPDAVRIEELVNYFPYDYAGPDSGAPFSVHAEVGSCPWAPEHRLVRIGLKGRETHRAERPSSNLVFLIDVSGSMNSADKLPLLKKALHMLVQQLDERDTISIVVYASAQGLALPPTRCSTGADIHAALDRLSAGGSTNGGAGIELAYRIAAENYVEGGINRVLLATDGDFNVGVTSDGALVRMIEEKAKTGVFLSVLGFGTGNLQDSKMEQLADKGNGNYAYIDSVMEARKVLVEQMGATLETIAKDVKIQVEFNPVEVKGYRLIGYENRLLAAQDFNDDTKDAGEIGAGHTVTALYEVVPAGAELEVPGVDPLKYQTVTQASGEAFSGELLTLKLRYKEPEGSTSKLLVFPITDGRARFEEMSADSRWAASVAAFGLVLRDSRYQGTADLDAVSRWAVESLGEDPGGYRAQFIGLVGRAKQLSRR